MNPIVSLLNVISVNEAVDGLLSLSSGQTEGHNLKLTIPKASAVFKRPLDTPPPQVFKQASYVNKGMMIGLIGQDNTLPLYEDLLPFNFELYKLIATNTLSLCNMKLIENVDLYNLNLLAYISCQNTYAF
jgi:hypothetical protein